jgi:hypothetical protein
MILALHSDALHLSEPGPKSRAAGHFYLTKEDNSNINNRAILTLSKIIKDVMAPVFKSEVAPLFYKCKAAILLRMTLQEMGHQQPKTRFQTRQISMI